MENVKKSTNIIGKQEKVKKKFKFNSAYLYILPWFIGFLVFKLNPFFNALLLSFQQNNLIREPKWVKLQNYQQLLFEDELFKTSLIVTFKYVFLTVPLVLVFALFIAYILNFKIKGVNFFRTAYYIPSILGGSVAVSIVWKFIFGNDGVINAMLDMVGLEPVMWLTDTRYALIVLSLLKAWQFGSVMVIFLSALQNVPQSLYEAASIDGAGKWRSFFTITVPMITPVILFNAVQLLVKSFQEFNSAYLISDGGPLNSTYLLNLFIYKNAFSSFKMGYASAASWIMFIIIMALTAVVFRSSNYWVHYND
ncbi:sn-glycerol-3-phosphate transport system permease protein ugpA [Turicibacter sanguinis]|nr:sugar ABC transporter permease [Turicibacter sp.]CUO12703.1 sn-glycerol-3-phosphate transport system permease protein ugpA [Turicibacter sanguinis]